MGGLRSWISAGCMCMIPSCRQPYPSSYFSTHASSHSIWASSPRLRRRHGWTSSARRCDHVRSWSMPGSHRQSWLCRPRTTSRLGEERPTSSFPLQMFCPMLRCDLCAPCDALRASGVPRAAWIRHLPSWTGFNSISFPSKNVLTQYIPYTRLLLVNMLFVEQKNMLIQLFWRMGNPNMSSRQECSTLHNFEMDHA